MISFAITNQKGGSGKTTTAVNLAAALADRRQRVLVIDLDPQANASQWLGFSDLPEEDRGLLDVLFGERRLETLVRSTEVEGLDLVPSSSWLVGAEKSLAGEVGAETLLRQTIAALPSNRWDFLFIDCPPSLGLLAISALAAVEHVLVPVESRVMALAGLAALVRTIGVVQQRLNPELSMFAILACRVDLRTKLSREVIARLRDHFGAQVFETTIRENVRLAEAPSFAEPITRYDARSAGALDYEAAAREFLMRLGIKSRKRPQSSTAQKSRSQS